MTDAVVPCEKNDAFEHQVRQFAEALRSGAHTLGNHGLTKEEFEQAGLFRAAVERIRGQNSATMDAKRPFVAAILDDLKSRNFILDWQSSGGGNRFDYQVTLLSKRISVIEIKGCLDGNNTNIFDRPAHADEFIIWSLCQNPGADPRRNVWSGVHTRLTAEIIDRGHVVDAIIVWDMLCGTHARICPKLQADGSRATKIGPYTLPPPCIYLLPDSVPTARNNAKPRINEIADVGFAKALYDGFKCRPDEINSVSVEVAHRGADIVRTTAIMRGGRVVKTSKPIPIRRK